MYWYKPSLFMLKAIASSTSTCRGTPSQGDLGYSIRADPPPFCLFNRFSLSIVMIACISPAPTTQSVVQICALLRALHQHFAGCFLILIMVTPELPLLRVRTDIRAETSKKCHTHTTCFIRSRVLLLATYHSFIGSACRSLLVQVCRPIISPMLLVDGSKSNPPRVVNVSIVFTVSLRNSSPRSRRALHYTAQQSDLLTACTCHEPAVELCTGLSLTMSILAFSSRLSFNLTSNYLLFSDVFSFSICPRYWYSREQSPPVLCSRHNQLCPCCGSCSVAILGKKADEN